MITYSQHHTIGNHDYSIYVDGCNHILVHRDHYLIRDFTPITLDPNADIAALYRQHIAREWRQIRASEQRQAMEKTLEIWRGYKPEPDPPDLDTWPCCPICGEYLDDDGECLMVKDGEATHEPLVRERSE